MMTTAAPKSSAQICPICRKVTAEAFRPFCSKRCADIDLSRWLKGVYVVPSEEDPVAEPDDWARGD